MPSKVLLIIVDGFGLSVEEGGNAIVQANTPTFDELFAKCPAISLDASGAAVGLTEHSPGNSEVGHRALGTGQVAEHLIRRAENDIKSGAFFANESIKEAVKRAKDRSKKIHLVGLLTDVTTHASESVLYALIDMMGKEGATTKLYLHLFLDGRDTQQRSGQKQVERLYLNLRDRGYGSIATLIGREYAMDRDGRWERIGQAWQLMTQLKGQVVRSPLEGVLDSYGAGQDDEHLGPLVIDANGKIEPGDTVIIFNHRADRIRELTEKFAAAEIEDLQVLTFTKYYPSMPFATIYDDQHLEPNLTSTLTAAGKRVLKISETERYAHLTYFFNGGNEDPYQGEDRSFVPSLRVANVTEHPELAIRELTKRVTDACQKALYDLIVVNIPNCDVLGHTGNLEATKLAVRAVDASLNHILKAAAKDYTTLITADHGNAEYMMDKLSGEIRKEDTTSPVPLILVSTDYRTGAETTYVQLAALPPVAVLTDVTTTILKLLAVPAPPEMSGIDLIKDGGLS